MKCTYLSLTLLVPVLAFSMEEQKPEVPSNAIILDLEAGQSGAKLSADLVNGIKAGKTSHINQLLTKRTTRSVGTQTGTAQSMDQIVSALGFTEGELEIQQQQMAQKVMDHFWTRYKHVLIPAGITAAAAANLITNAATYAAIAAPTPEERGSFSINMISSGSAMLGGGWKTWLQLKKGWTDHRQKKVVEQLKNSQLLLELLKKNAMVDGVITPEEQAVIDAAQRENANLQVEVAQATINADNAKKEADDQQESPVVPTGDNNNNNNATGAPTEETPTEVSDK